MRTPSIYQIKRDVKNAPYFFSRSSMSFFGQKLKDFKVYKTEDPIVVKIVAECKIDQEIFSTIRFYNTETHMFIKGVYNNGQK